MVDDDMNPVGENGVGKDPQRPIAFAAVQAKEPKHVVIANTAAVDGWSEEEPTGIKEDPSQPRPPTQEAVPASAPRAPESVFRWTRGRVLAALGGAGAVAIAGCSILSVGVNAIVDYLQKADQADMSTCDVSDDLAQKSTVREDPTCEGAEEAPRTLFAQVESKVLSDETVSKLSDREITRLTAHATNKLVSEHFAEANSWEDLKGSWKNGALDLVVNKLETWGGYEAVLDSIEASPTPITTIDGALQWIASDGNLDSASDPHNSDQTALALAKQIAMIDDPRIAADPRAPQGHLEEMAPDEVELAVSEDIQTPPPAPAHFSYPSLTPEQAAALYDAPEPMNLNGPVDVDESDLEEIITEPEFVMADPTSVPEPRHLFSKEYQDFFQEGDRISAANAAAVQKQAAEGVPPIHEPIKTFTEKAKEAVKGWASKVSRWFS